MPAYVVTIHRSKTEIAKINVDANNAEDAEELAYTLGEKNSCVWHTDGWQFDLQETTVDVSAKS